MRAAAVRGDGKASLPAHELPPVNMGAGALALLQGRSEGHGGSLGLSRGSGTFLLILLFSQ